MPQTVDRIDFACTNVDPSQWPRLSCGENNQLVLEAGSLQLEADRELLFQDNGQIRSFDDNHKLVFNRTGKLLELHAAGDIRFLTGAPVPTEKLRIRADGNAGIGTDTPDAKLHVAGDIRADGSLRVTANTEVGGNLSVAGGTNLGDNTQVQGDLQVSGVVNATDIHKNGSPLRLSQWDDVAGGITYAAGNVGIGTTNPRRPLSVRGQGVSEELLSFEDSSGDTKWHINQNLRGNNPGLNFVETGIADGRLFIQAGGNVGVGTTDPIFGLDVRGAAQGWIGSGDSSQSVGGWRLGRWPDYSANTWVYLSRVDSTVYQDLAVGALWAGGALRFGTADDLAEMTPVRPEDRLEPGDVVIIDEPDDDRVLLTKSKTAYDPKVAGVISDPTQVGLVIGGSHPTDIARDDVKPVALVGRVLTKVTTENGAINAGDLLTTAATSGYAMKASKPGPILGKAMQSFRATSGDMMTGKIWVHVNLGWYGAEE